MPTKNLNNDDTIADEDAKTAAEVYKGPSLLLIGQASGGNEQPADFTAHMAQKVQKTHQDSDKLHLIAPTTGPGSGSGSSSNSDKELISSRKITASEKIDSKQIAGSEPSEYIETEDLSKV